MLRIIILLVSYGLCQAQDKGITDCELLTNAVNSTQFSGWYDAEAKDGTPVVLYDGADNGKPVTRECDSITLAGKGILIVKPLDFEGDINGIKQKVINPRIILHKFEKTGEGHTIAFLYSELNQILTLYYNRQGELTDYESGAF